MLGFRLKLRNRGFTLIEMLVVIAIVGVLVGMLIPALQSSRESARRISCANNMKQCALALTSYESRFKSFPAGLVSPGPQKREWSTWLFSILPDIEQNNVYDQGVADYTVSPSPFSGHGGFQTVIQTYQCPSNNGSGEVVTTHGGVVVATTNYLGVNGTNYKQKDGVLFKDSRTLGRDICDGLSNTLLFGERPPSADYWYGWWYAGLGNVNTGTFDMLMGVREVNDPPSQYLEVCDVGPHHFGPGDNSEQCDTVHFWSNHGGGAQFAMCDGSVHLFNYSSNDILPQLATIRGKEPVTIPE